ncbi:response regulator transcription factor [Gordonia phthalatica]|uniref:Chemotaxis protein CheY n=1 Tax=Gordonia phthalatica TaxID=1136941 RepID=A0A0N9NBN5_9ACTN|nr:response regulator transcription factor [Gordonia phthalatica]ALG84432.1 chemotaxis protein CheY [Gordonia phthalatica]
MTGPASPSADNRVTLRVLVYSDNPNTRRQVLGALGEQLHPDLPDLQFIEVATASTVLSHLDRGGVDLAILDGEAAPTGGMGLAKQIRDEYEPCPPLLVLIARQADRWLADWSRADATANLPIDPLKLPRIVIRLLKQPARK